MSPAAPLDPERWRRVNDLFHRALQEAPIRREAFLGSETSDPAIRAEVAALLATHDRAGDFIEQPASESDPPESRRSPSDAPPLRVGPYDILNVIGAGGMGIVYLARDTRLGRTVALKALPPRSMVTDVQQERLRREARAAAALQHPGIATVFALEDIDGQLYIASEYVAGDTLRDELHRGPLPPLEAAETGLAIARALAVAHQAGIVHRDLKPENVIRSRSGQVKILDFGLARLPPDDAAPITRDGSVVGTPAYMSPEQIRGVPVDGRSDLFSLGVLIYELVTGFHPFQSGDAPATLARILEAEPAPPSTLVAGAQPLDTVVSACLSKDRDGRPRSPLDVATALERAIAQLRAGSIAPSAPTGSSAIATTDHTFETRARWWWRFHQAIITVCYGLLLIPLWYARPYVWADRGRSVFLVAVVAAMVSGILRLHLWFADDLYPSEWNAQHRRAFPWIRAADFVFVAILLIAGIQVLDAESVLAIVLVAGAVSALISFAIIEPATTAVFRDKRN